MNLKNETNTIIIILLVILPLSQSFILNELFNLIKSGKFFFCFIIRSVSIFT